MSTFTDTLVLKDKVTSTLRNITSSLYKMNDRLDASSRKMDELRRKTERIKDVGRNLSIGLTLPIVAAGAGMIKLAAEMESTQMMFSTMLGDANKASTLIKDIQTMAAQTPMTTRTLLESTKLLLNFNYAQEKVLPMMRRLGDISGGNEDRFKRLTLAFAQASSAGRLMGQDLLQMVNTGFNPLQVISEKTGETMLELKKRMEAGQISIAEVEEAIVIATSAGGKFYNLMEKQSQTLEGRFSTLLDEVQMLAIELGTHLLPIAKQIIEVAIKVGRAFGNMSPFMQKTVLVVGGLLAVLGPLMFLLGSLPVVLAGAKIALTAITGAFGVGVTVVKAISGAIGVLRLALIALGLTPIMATIIAWTAGIAALIGAVYLAIKAFQKLFGWIKKTNAEKAARVAGEVNTGSILYQGQNRQSNTTNNTFNNSLTMTNAISKDVNVDEVMSAAVNKMNFTAVPQGA